MKQKKLKIVALVPARGGSKSIPYKNIRPMGGKPLIYWTLKAAGESKYINEVYLSTEDEKIKTAAKALNLKARVIDRPKKFATDTASTESVMLHFARKMKFDFDILVTIQATSPLTTSKELDSAIKQFLRGKKDSLLTSVRTKRFFWNDSGRPLNYNPFKRPRRQDFKGSLVENGAFYITKKNILKKYKNRLGGKIDMFEMQSEHVVDIDEPGDWAAVETILLNRIQN